MRLRNHHELRVLFISLLICTFLSGFAFADYSGNDATLLTSKGFDLYKQARFNESLDSFNRAILLDPYNEPPWYGKGLAHFALKDYQGAITALDRAIELSPKDEQAWMKEGDVFTAMGRKDLAVNAYKRVTLLNPNNSDAKKNLAALSTPSSTATVTTISSPMVTATSTTVTNTVTALQTQPVTPIDIPIIPFILVLLVLVALILIWYFLDQVKGFFRKKSGTLKQESNRFAIFVSGIRNHISRSSSSPQEKPVGAPPEKAAGMPVKIPTILIISGVLIILLAIFFLASVLNPLGNVGLSKSAGSSIPLTTSNAEPLREYRDQSNYFSIGIPEKWSLSVSDSIVASDTSDGGITRVRIQPVHLSGKYRSMTAGDIANYLIGKDKQGYSQFTVDDVRASQDGKVLVVTSSFLKNGISMRGVYTIFVNTPYAILSSYETRKELFSGKEGLLRAIIESYRQENPPAPLSTTQVSWQSTIGPLQPTVQTEGIHILLPKGWNTLVLPGCSGLVAVDPVTGPRGVVFLNGLHQSIQPLPPGVTPEQYLTTYMPEDFSVGGKTVSDVRILTYENLDVSALNQGNINAKPMRISFNSNGVPCTGSFTVATYQTGVSTAVASMWGIFSTSDRFTADAPELLKIFYSIDYSSSTLHACMGNLNTAWEGAHKVGDTLTRNADQMREENLKLYEGKQEHNDEFMEKFTDTILDRDRVYNPDTGEVYEVDPNFYTYYDINRDQFKYQDMRELQPGEWLKYSPLNGALHIQ